MYLFGYGSLLNLSSAQKSFKRKLNQSDLIEAYINGYEKVWNSIEHIYFNDLNNQFDGVFLNLNENINSTTNGILIKITDEELEYLKLREKNYSCIEINTENLLNIKLDEKIFTFMTTNPNKIAKINNNKTIIAQKYIDIMTSSLINYSEKFQKDFLVCLNNLPFDIKEGTYNFSDFTQNKLAKVGILETK